MTMVVQNGRSGCSSSSRPRRSWGPHSRRAGTVQLAVDAPLTLLLSKRSLLPRSTCGDYPIVWKECTLARSTILFRIVTVAAALAIAMPLAGITWNYAAPAFEELRLHGYGSSGFTSARDQFNEFLRVTMKCLFVLLAPGPGDPFCDEHHRGEGEKHLDEPSRDAHGGGRDRRGQALRCSQRSTVARPGVRSIPGLGPGTWFDPSAGWMLFHRPDDGADGHSGWGRVDVLDALEVLCPCPGSHDVDAARRQSPAIVLRRSGGTNVPSSLVFVSPVLLGLSLASFDDMDRFSRGANHDFYSEVLSILILGLVLHLTAAWALWKSCVLHFDNAVDRPRSDLSSRRSSFGGTRAGYQAHDTFRSPSCARTHIPMAEHS